MREVYIVATYTGTALSALIKQFSDNKYAHISISLNQDLRPMYAFGRIYPQTPFIAGLVKENINEGLYAIKKNTVCRVYSVKVTKEQYENIARNIDYMWNNRQELKYDVKALVRLKINRPRASYNKYVCSNFVSHILEMSGVDLFDKPYHIVQPIDFLNLSNSDIIYEGLLRYYHPTMSTPRQNAIKAVTT